MGGRRRRSTRSVGVSLEIDVLEYLQELSERHDRDRSFCINQIIREHAQRHAPAPTVAPSLAGTAVPPTPREG